MSSVSHHTCNLIDQFSLKERVIMRTAWAGFTAIGVWGIYRQDPLWSLLYLIYVLAGFGLVVLPGLCAHCPYPSQFSTCLFLPPGLVQRFYPYRGPRMSPLGKVAVLVVMAGMVVFPQFWLIHDPAVLALFWLTALPVIATFPLHYCRRCRHRGCPMNRVANSSATESLPT